MNRIFAAALAAVVAGLISHPVDAQDSSSSMKLNDAKPSESKAPSEDVDELITNKLLRAESGSKSKWSIASTVTYNGGTVSSPFSEDRPNITKSTGTDTKSDLEGQISGKYNFNARNSLMAGAGMRWIAPLSANGPHDYEGTRFDAYNPYLTYQYLYKALGVQAVLTFTGTGFTEANLVAEGYVSQFQIDQESMAEIGETGLSIGASMWIQGQTFNKTGPAAGYDDVREDQSDYAFGFFPEVEYEITDKINFRTIFGLWSYEHKRNEPAFNTYFWDKVYISAGIGLSITRDIYLFPNVQFLPDANRADLTNVALQANINLF